MDFKIRFSGLCNFVPVYMTSKLVKVWVLLVNAEDPDTIPGGKIVGTDLVAFAHSSFIRFPMEYVVPGAPPGTFGLWPIGGSDIQILDGNGMPISGGPVVADPTLSSKQSPASDLEAKSMFWVVDTGLVESGHARVNSDCINSDVSKVPSDLVSSRLEIFGGSFSSSVIVSRPGSPPMPIVWRFEPPMPGVYSQALAEEVSLDMKLATNSVTLLRTSRSDGDLQELVLTQVAGKIEIAIVNLEPDSVLGVGDRKRTNRIEEFRWFYKLSEKTASTIYPIPVADATEGGNPYCPMAKSSA